MPAGSIWQTDRPMTCTVIAPPGLLVAVIIIIITSCSSMQQRLVYLRPDQLLRPDDPEVHRDSAAKSFIDI